jgi:PAS domain S-box-containing protein
MPQTQRATADHVPAALLIAAIDLIADGVALVDGNGIILFANRPLGDLVGYESSALAGQPIELLVPAAKRGDHYAARSDYATDPHERSMGRADLDIEAQHADGRLIPVDVQLTPLPGTSVVAATVRDMTEQRRQAVERAIERLGLVTTMQRNEQLMAYYDVMIQQLFALGTHFEAQSVRDTSRQAGRFRHAATLIDQLIDMTRSQAFAPNPTNPPFATS